ncbi:hypothetical protein [Spiroplasma endosymbiont of Notiophilus biguttatus]|uniref:hypothetical protein n=1 Tax=Spiroplasma endosymbiont of Notiophilus biguttatus TaxID=3066285 RepID=UPI00313BDA10
MKKIKKILPLLTSITLLSGPVLLLVACDNERDMTNLPSGKIPDDYKNRVLFNFLGVNFNETISAQFKNTYSQGLDFILKDVEGTIAQQKFYGFFHNKLHYSENTKNADGTTAMGEANKAFIKLKDDLGLSLLTQKYLSGINTANSLDKVSAADNNELLFQNQSWHQDGTSKFNYQNLDFYKEKNDATGKVNDPDQIFTPDSLYKDYGDKGDVAFDEQLAAIAKHPDDNYSDEIGKLLPNDAKKWNSSAGINKTQKGLSNEGIPTYSKYLKRFQWWLRFRYQQYYQYEILPALNQTLFTMSYILDNIVDIKDNAAGKLIISTQTNNLYISQLQDTTSWQKSNYNATWNFTTDLANAQSIDKKWNNSPSEPPKWESIVKDDDSGKGKTLNSDFFIQLTSGNASTISEIDPNFGANGFLSTAANWVLVAGWVPNGGLHYTTNNNIATFTYSAPIYFLNLLQNLDFSFLKNNKNEGWVPEISNLIHSWSNSGNASLKTDFSKYIRGDGNESTITQETKWNIFWQMLYSISASDSATKDSPATENFKIAAQNLFPTYIPKNNIYEEGFWSKVKEFYP